MKNTKETNKLDKGITLVSLIITIAVMLIVASTSISISYDRFEINNYNKMKNDIELLSDKVNNYYLKYTGLPTFKDDTGTNIEYPSQNLIFDKNPNDNEIYYVLDLNAMEGIALNYGKEGFEAITESKTIDVEKDIDVYIINKQSHQIYYVQGIEMDDVVYHSVFYNADSINDIIPPSKPQINVISGTKNHDDTYMTEVELEFIPGNNAGKKATKTEISLDNGTTWEKMSTNNNVYKKITENGTYNIIAKSYDEQGNTSETKMDITAAILRIGDKIEYDEGTGHTSEIDSEFVMKDLEWRVLDIEPDGTIELISTQPTDSTLTLSGENDWLKGEDKLDTLCDDLYGQGTWATNARSLKRDDVDKLAGIITDEDKKAIYSDYGSKWQFRYSVENSIMEYRESLDDGKTWTDWANMTTSHYNKFYEPGKDVINSKNYLDSEGNLRTVNLIEDTYFYNISEKIPNTMKTTDKILISSLITNGLNDTNDGAYGTIRAQWLASKNIECSADRVSFYISNIANTHFSMSRTSVRTGYGGNLKGTHAVRPVIKLKPNLKLTLVNDVWQISE